MFRVAKLSTLLVAQPASALLAAMLVIKVRLRFKLFLDGQLRNNKKISIPTRKNLLIVYIFSEVSVNGAKCLAK